MTECNADNIAIFAVGDVHGRLDLLQLMHQNIMAENLPPHTKKYVVYLGDYIDRGPNSAEIIEQLVTQPLEGFEQHFLLGNHECALLRFVLPTLAFGEWALSKGFIPEDLNRMTTERMLNWLNKHGGAATLKSYGLDTPTIIEPQHLPNLQIALQQAMPPAHIDFLQNLQLYCMLNGHYFVHAGVDFSQTPENQQAWEQITIREAFLNPPKPAWPYRVVHGHTIHPQPLVLLHRVALDTGAYLYGTLTAAMFYGGEIKLLYASDSD